MPTAKVLPEEMPHLDIYEPLPEKRKRIKREKYLDEDNYTRITKAHNAKKKLQAALEDAERKIHVAQVQEGRANVEIARAEHRQKVAQRKLEGVQYREYLHWLKEQDGDVSKEQQMEKINAERERKQRLPKQMMDLLSERATEADKIKAAIDEGRKLRKEKESQELDEHRRQIDERKGLSAYNRLQLRNTHAQQMARIADRRVAEREANMAIVKARKGEHSEERWALAEQQRAATQDARRNLAKLPRKQVPKPRRTVSMQSIAPSENAEIDRWLDEMKRAEEKLHESRKEFELAALKTADLVTNLGGRLPASSPRALSPVVSPGASPIAKPLDRGITLGSLISPSGKRLALGSPKS